MNQSDMSAEHQRAIKYIRGQLAHVDGKHDISPSAVRSLLEAYDIALEDAHETPPNTSAVGEWTVGRQGTLFSPDGFGFFIGGATIDNELLANRINASLAALREQLEQAQRELKGFRQSQEFREKMGIKTEDAKWLDPECWDGCMSLVFKQQLASAQAALKQMREALRLISDAVPRFQVALSMPAGFPVSKQLPPQGYDVWLHDFIAGVINIQPDSSALKAVTDSANAATLTPREQPRAETGNAQEDKQ